MNADAIIQQQLEELQQEQPSQFYTVTTQVNVTRDSLDQTVSKSSLPQNQAYLAIQSGLKASKGTQMSLTRANVGARGSGSDTIEIDHDMSFTIRLGFYLRHSPVQPCLMFDDFKLKKALDAGLIDSSPLSKRQATLPVFCFTSNQELFDFGIAPEPSQTNIKVEKQVPMPRSELPACGVHSMYDYIHTQQKSDEYFVPINVSGSSLYVANYCGFIPRHYHDKQNVYTVISQWMVGRDTSLWYSNNDSYFDGQAFNYENAMVSMTPRPATMVGLKLKLQEAPAFEICPQYPDGVEASNSAQYIKQFDFSLTPSVADGMDDLYAYTQVADNMKLAVKGSYSASMVVRKPNRVLGSRNMRSGDLQNSGMYYHEYMNYSTDMASELSRTVFSHGVASDRYAAINTQPIAPPLYSATANLGAAKILPAVLRWEDNGLSQTEFYEEYIGYSKGLGKVLFVGSEAKNLQKMPFRHNGNIKTTNLGKSFAPYYKDVTLTVTAGYYSVGDLVNSLNDQLQRMKTLETYEDETKTEYRVDCHDSSAQDYKAFATKEYLADGYNTRRKCAQTAAMQAWTAEIPEELGFLNYVVVGAEGKNKPFPDHISQEAQRDIRSLKGLCGNAEFLIFKNLQPVPIPISPILNFRYTTSHGSDTNDYEEALQKTPLDILVARDAYYFLDDIRDGHISKNGARVGKYFSSLYRNQLWHLEFYGKKGIKVAPEGFVMEMQPLTMDCYKFVLHQNLKSRKVNISKSGVFHDFAIGGLTAQINYNEDFSRLELTNLHSRFTLSDFTPKIQPGLPYCFKQSYVNSRGFSDDKPVHGRYELIERLGFDGGSQSYTYAPMYERMSVQAEAACGIDMSNGVFGCSFPISDGESPPQDIINPVAEPVIPTVSTDGIDTSKTDGVTVFGNHLPDTNKSEGLSGFNGAFVLKWYGDDSDLELLFLLGFNDVTEKNKLIVDETLDPFVDENGKVYPYYYADSVYAQYEIGHTHDRINYSVVKDRSTNINGINVINPPFQFSSIAPVGFDQYRSGLHAGKDTKIRWTRLESITTAFDSVPSAIWQKGSLITEHPKLRKYGFCFSWAEPQTLFYKEGTLPLYAINSAIVNGVTEGDIPAVADRLKYNFRELKYAFQSVNDGWGIFKLSKHSFNVGSADNTLKKVSGLYFHKLNGKFPKQPPLGYELGLLDQNSTEDDFCYTTRIASVGERINVINAIFHWVFGAGFSPPSNSNNVQKRGRVIYDSPVQLPMFYRNTQQSRVIVFTESKGLRANTLPQKMRFTNYVLQLDGVSNLFPTYSYMLTNGTTVSYVGVINKLSSSQDRFAELALGTTGFEFKSDTDISEISITVINPDGTVPQCLDGNLDFGLQFICPVTASGKPDPPYFGPGMYASLGLQPSAWGDAQLNVMIQEELMFIKIRDAIKAQAAQMHMTLDQSILNDLAVRISDSIQQEQQTAAAATSTPPQKKSKAGAS